MLTEKTSWKQLLEKITSFIVKYLDYTRNTTINVYPRPHLVYLYLHIVYTDNR